MQIIYRTQVDAAFYRALITRYYRQLPFVLWLPVQFGSLGLVVAVLGFWLVSDHALGAIWIWVVVGILVSIGGVILTRRGIVSRFKRKADFGTESTVILSEKGIMAHGNQVEGKWTWAAYPRAVRFSDGILLLRRGVIRWLPDADIQEGDISSATDLVATKTAMRYVS